MEIKRPKTKTTTRKDFSCDTCVNKRIGDTLMICLIVAVSLSLLLHMHMFKRSLSPSLSSHSHTAPVSSLRAAVPCCRLAVTTPVQGLLFRRKACVGQILFRQIKKSMSSCLHQSTHCLSDGPTRYTTAPPYLSLALSLSYSSVLSLYLHPTSTSFLPPVSPSLPLPSPFFSSFIFVTICL